MIESLVSVVGQRGVDAAAFLLAFALTALTDSLFHNKLPHDHGREFAVNGGTRASSASATAGATTSRARATWPASSTCRSAAPTAPSATFLTRASSKNAACTPRRAGTPPSGTASCARDCRPERWQPLTIRQGSRRERVTK